MLLILGAFPGVAYAAAAHIKDVRAAGAKIGHVTSGGGRRDGRYRAGRSLSRSVGN